MSIDKLSLVPPLLVAAQSALQESQAGLGSVMGVSRKTIGWWQSGRTMPAPFQVQALARVVHAVNPALAGKLAAASDTTLAALGLDDPASDAPQVPLGPRALGDLLVCAATEAYGPGPRAMRAALLAALARAKELGLGVEQASSALRSEPQTAERK